VEQVSLGDGFVQADSLFESAAEGEVLFIDAAQKFQLPDGGIFGLPRAR
jgi:hypothetical protein